MTLITDKLQLSALCQFLFSNLTKWLLSATPQSCFIYLPERQSELLLHFPTGLSSYPLPESILLGTAWSCWSGRNSQTEGANQGYWDVGPRHAPKRGRQKRGQHNLGSFCWLATLGLMGRECKFLSRAKFGGVWSERQTVETEEDRVSTWECSMCVCVCLKTLTSKLWLPSVVTFFFWKRPPCHTPWYSRAGQVFFHFNEETLRKE